jgi:hypothetical protein
VIDPTIKERLESNQLKCVDTTLISEAASRSASSDAGAHFRSIVTFSIVPVNANGSL